MDAFPEAVLVLRDADLKTYFERSLPIFIKRLENFKKAATLTLQEEREMRFMLEALLEAKRALLEKNAGGRHGSARR